MKKAIVIFLILALILSLVLTSIPVMAVTENYSDINLSSNGTIDSGHFDDIWDLTEGDITLSFTYDANGMVDDSGAHAWAELGMRSVDTALGPLDFNPYWRLTGYSYDCTQTLFADQDIAVGSVTCTGDEETLVVEYDLDDPWKMFQAHVQVGVTLDDIPQKKGNPIPGHFTVNIQYDPPVAGDTFTIDLSTVPDYTSGDSLYIAAHAVVGRPLASMETVWQIGDVEVINSDTGWLENYADEFNWGDPADPITAGPTLAEEQPDYTSPFIVDSTPTEEFPYNANKNRNYATDIDVVWNGGLPFGGKLSVSWSPGQSATEKKVVSDGGFPVTTLIAYGVPQTGMGWFLDRYPLVQHEIMVSPVENGEHAINFEHTQGDGTFWDWIRLEKPCERRETAWADGEDFPGKNWATCMVCSPDPVYSEGSGVWLSTDYDWGVDTFDPDTLTWYGPPFNGYYGTLDLDDKLILQRMGGQGEGAYNLPSVPPFPGNNHRFWWDRDGVDPWQNDETANTGGLYEIVITLHATSPTAGTASMTINGLSQGFETDGNWNTIELTPAGMTFTGDMEHLQVFYGLYGYVGATHTVTFSDIAVTQ